MVSEAARCRDWISQSLLFAASFLRHDPRFVRKDRT